MYLTLERLEAPGSGEVWLGRGLRGGDILMEMKEEAWDVEQSAGALGCGIRSGL